MRKTRRAESKEPEIPQEGTPLDEIVRLGAQRMLQAAIDAEVAAFLAQHAELASEDGKRRIVRNGYLPKRTLLTGAGGLVVQQPRVRDRAKNAEDSVCFSPAVLPRYLRRSKNLDELIPWLYLKGVSTGDFAEALQALLGPDAKALSPSVIVRLKDTWAKELEAWEQRDLSSKEYVYVWADGVYFNVRLDDDRVCMLVLIGATKDGRKELIAIHDGYRESEQSWRELIVDLKRRGLRSRPKLAVGDGALGFWAAVRKVWPDTKHQRCWVHKTANVLNKLPKTAHRSAKKALHQIWQAETKENAEKAFDAFLETYGAKYKKATDCLDKDREELLSFYEFPAQHWVHVRTTNPIESTFATVRLRHRKTKGNGSRLTTLTMVFKLMEAAEKGWRRLNSPTLVLDVYRGQKFVNGEPKDSEKEAA